ncbi:hypothetical protein B0H67DRAFT_101783 [Lasiosphaeris hirsuta]|uniref:Uncharacterized protein n=1 Tax=Lasiosphaeris hirsuta TaxID=260670 RepID=A0AA40AYG1_9PEZI|nr:hypothetical protein B0H67DRAFT_101783 [Lasiosphaeris hirsuta]
MPACMPACIPLHSIAQLCSHITTKVRHAHPPLRLNANIVVIDQFHAFKSTELELFRPQYRCARVQEGLHDALQEADPARAHTSATLTIADYDSNDDDFPDIRLLIAPIIELPDDRVPANLQYPDWSGFSKKKKNGRQLTPWSLPMSRRLLGAAAWCGRRPGQWAWIDGTLKSVDSAFSRPRPALWHFKDCFFLAGALR